MEITFGSLDNYIFTDSTGGVDNITAGNIQINSDLLTEDGCWKIACAYFENPNGLDDVLENYLKKWESEYEIINERETFGVRFQNIINKAVESTGKKAVVLIDEYDKPMLDVLGTELEEENRNTLKGFYGAFKSADAHLRFVFLTGVTKFSQVSVFSEFNQPDD